MGSVNRTRGQHLHRSHEKGNKMCNNNNNNNNDDDNDDDDNNNNNNGFLYSAFPDSSMPMK